MSLIVDLPDEIEAKVKECARRAHESETQIIRRVIEQYLTNGSSVWPSDEERARRLAQFEAARNLAELQVAVEECGEDIEPDETRNELLRRLQGTLSEEELTEMNLCIEECFEQVEPDLWK